MEQSFTGNGVKEHVLEWIDWAALGIECVAVLVIIGAIAYSTTRFLLQTWRGASAVRHYRLFKNVLGRSLLLSLEILVAADIVRTVALEPTLSSILFLSLLLIIRTFLNWSLVLEIESRWPWQPETRDTFHPGNAREHPDLPEVVASDEDPGSLTPGRRGS